MSERESAHANAHQRWRLVHSTDMAECPGVRTQGNGTARTPTGATTWGQLTLLRGAMLPTSGGRRAACSRLPPRCVPALVAPRAAKIRIDTAPWRMRVLGFW
ncbi:hypothetical protein MRX96_008347 [Rhipicephalus microplus]